MIYFFPFLTELSHLTNLKELDLSDSGVNGTPNIQGKGRLISFTLTILINPN